MATTDHRDLALSYDGDDTTATATTCLWMQLVMVRRRLCSITVAAPVAERACSLTASAPWCSAPSTQRRPSLQLVEVGRLQGSTTDVAHLGWACLLIDRMDTQVWCSAPNTPRRPSPRWARPRPSHRTTRFLWGSRRRRRVVAAASDGGGIARSQNGALFFSACCHQTSTSLIYFMNLSGLLFRCWC